MTDALSLGLGEIIYNELFFLCDPSLSDSQIDEGPRNHVWLKEMYQVFFSQGFCFLEQVRKF